jgi:protein tyrosine phosphatase (PTP) superfamily phosphohydrolase (DUF442 family)
MRLLLLAARILCSLAVAARASDLVIPVATTTLQNVFKLDGSLYSGNAPESEEAFRELAKLGVKTIISVDGAKPNLDLAYQFGMRYVHLPIGYDAVPKSRAAELVKAALGADGPLYVHCHHGKHRGPAAAATICRARDGWSAERAEEFLKQAGTAADYAGLFRDVRDFSAPTAEELARLPAKFPEIAETPDLVDTMVAIDKRFDALKAARQAAWREVPGHPDLAPQQEAVLLWEQLRELTRDPDTEKRGDDYRARLLDSERAAAALRQLFEERGSTVPSRDAAVQQVTETCAACHKAHRN